MPLRYSLAYLRRSAYDDVVGQVRDTHYLPLVREWLAREWPLELVRESGTGAPTMHLRFVLPPDFNRKEIGVRLSSDAIRAMRRPCCLGEVVDGAPAEWRGRLEALREKTAMHGLSLDVIGPFAWQALVGWPYLERASRIHLICRPASVAQILEVDRLIGEWEKGEGHAATLEIAFPSGQSVMRDEWLQARLKGASSTRVRAIALREVALVSIYSLEAQLATKVALA